MSLYLLFKMRYEVFRYKCVNMRIREKFYIYRQRERHEKHTFYNNTRKEDSTYT